MREAFDNEVGIHGPLSEHPNIVTIHHAGYTVGGNRPFFLMDLVEGGSLSDYLHDVGTVRWDHAVAWMIPICDAVQHIHEQGILHRDIKPANILFNPPSEPLLSDLGIACLEDDSSQDGAMSIPHVAPEALEGHRRDARSDVFSLGTTIYQLIVGDPPFGVQVLERWQNLNKPAPDLPPETGAPRWLNQLLKEALAQQPGERLATAGALRDGLKDGVDGRDIETPTLVMSVQEADDIFDDRPPHPSQRRSQGRPRWSPAVQKFQRELDRLPADQQLQHPNSVRLPRIEASQPPIATPPSIRTPREQVERPPVGVPAWPAAHEPAVPIVRPGQRPISYQAEPMNPSRRFDNQPVGRRPGIWTIALSFVMTLLVVAAAALAASTLGGGRDDQAAGDEVVETATELPPTTTEAAGGSSTTTETPTSSTSSSSTPPTTTDATVTTVDTLSTTDTTAPTTDTTLPQPIDVDVFFSIGSGDDCGEVTGYPRQVGAGTPIRLTLDQLLAGPTPAEQNLGASSAFSSATANSIRSIKLSDGLLVVDFHDFQTLIPGASSSCGSEALLAGLNSTVFQFPAVERVRYEFEGSCIEFGEWLQGSCTEHQR